VDWGESDGCVGYHATETGGGSGDAIATTK
jgi:hypothetical protein